MKKILILILLIISFFLMAVETQAAASLSLSPTTQSTPQGQTFNVNVVLNTGGTSSNGCDVILTFNPQIIKVQTVSFGSSPLFSSSNVSTPDNTNGKLILNSSVISSAFAYNGTGTLATITFKGESAGSSAVSFTCTAGSTTDTNIWNTQAQDIINCSSNIAGTYTITAGSGVTPTVTPTPGASGANPTATPEPPVVGNPSLTIFPLALGIISLLIGFSLKFIFLKG